MANQKCVYYYFFVFFKSTLGSIDPEELLLLLLLLSLLLTPTVYMTVNGRTLHIVWGKNRSMNTNKNLLFIHKQSQLGAERSNSTLP